MTETVVTSLPGTAALGRVRPSALLPGREPAQERYLRALRIRMIAMTVVFVTLLAHNRFILRGEHFIYVLLPLINLLDDALMYYLSWHGTRWKRAPPSRRRWRSWRNLC